MTDQLKEELLSALQDAANFMRGMTFDPEIPKHAKEACVAKYTHIENLVQKHLD